ncbi:MAG: DUF4097 family beta strand repeat protein [Acidimicrobiia bacterium]|nr:DUF4097 domain-containing protein [Acidimicrobiia bacterium]NNF10909.1 DUF4097 family beta strand repeat protein [Acidimicrobiia bacterium]NNL71636.1 DUF4097 family beta strand repeat protein [Acidimicrobiia bacterium]
MRERIVSFDVGPHPDVEVRIAAGHIQVNEGEPGAVHVSVSASNPDKLLVEQFRDHIQIGEEGRLRGSYRIRLDVPPGTDLVTAVASGNVDVNAPVGDVAARSASGDVAIATAAGRVEVKVASGDVTIEESRADTRVVSASGDVRIAQVGDDCSVSTASGDIDLGTITGSVNLKTASGNVVVRRYEGDNLIAKSVSGRLDLRIAPGRRADLDIRTLSGKVDLPPPRQGGPEPTGEVFIRAKSVSGNIKIDRA